MQLSDLADQGLHLGMFPLATWVILRAVLLLSAALPAIWSRHPARRRQALQVLRVLAKNNNDAATAEHHDDQQQDDPDQARAPLQGS